MTPFATSSKLCLWAQVITDAGAEQTHSCPGMVTGKEETENWKKEVLPSLLSVKETGALRHNKLNFPVGFGSVFIKMTSHWS